MFSYLKVIIIYQVYLYNLNNLHSIITLNKDGTLTGTINLGQSRPGSNGPPHSPKLQDRGRALAAEVQSECSTAPANRAVTCSIH